jgi:hypothetical protein
MNRSISMRLVGLCVSIVTIVAPVFAQQANLNLEGFVRDSVTGNPLGCKLHIYAPSSKRISISSNSKDGSYLQTLGEAGPHKIVIAGNNVYRKEVVVDIPKSERFKVIKHDFAVREIVEGGLLSSTQRGFDLNQPTLSSEGRKAIEDLAKILEVNSTMNVVVTLMGDEDRLSALRTATQAEYRKQHDAWTKAVKKLKKGQTPPTEPVMPADPVDPNVSLIEQRKANIVEMLKKVKSSDVRVSYVSKSFSVEQPAPSPVADPSATVAGKKGKKDKKATPAPPPAKAKSTASSEPNLVITIGKVRGLFD